MMAVLRPTPPSHHVSPTAGSEPRCFATGHAIRSIDSSTSDNGDMAEQQIDNATRTKLEKLFDMSGGYVLDFSNASFAAFVQTYPASILSGT